MTIYAYTQPHNDYPALVNLSAHEDGVKVSVRSTGNSGKDYASIPLSKEIAVEMALAVLNHYGINAVECFARLKK